MDFQWNEEQEMLRQTVRTFAERELRPIAFNQEERGDYPPEICRQMADMGLFGMTLPEEYEGGGRSPLDAIMVMEELGRVDPLAGGIVFGANFGPIRAVAVYSLGGTWICTLSRDSGRATVLLRRSALRI